MLAPDRTTPQDAPGGPARPRVLMLCAHEPTLDPRVRWEAESASERHQVTVLGFAPEDGARTASSTGTGYEIIRLPRRNASAFRYFWRFKDVLPWPSRILLLVALALLSPVILAGEVAAGVARSLLTGAKRRAASEPAAPLVASAQAVGASDRALRLRKSLPARLYYILNVLRGQFAPAAVLFWDYLARMAEKPQVIHCNDLDTLLVGVLARQRFGCRVVYDAHEFFPMSDPHGRWLDMTFFSWIERVLIRRADVAVTVNPMLAEAIGSAYGVKVHSAPNAEPWVENPSPARAEDDPLGKLAGGRTRFLFQGRFAPDRGIEELIAAWAKVDAQRAALFVRGPDNRWRQGAIDLARRLGVLDRGVYFLDAVPEDQLVAAAASADVGVIPYKPTIINDRLACPNKLSQYLHAGLMIVTNDLSYVKSVVADARAGLDYSSDDISTLVDVVHRIAGDPELLQRCRTNALQYARTTFNWQAQAQVFDELYAAAAPAPCVGNDAGGAPLQERSRVPVSQASVEAPRGRHDRVRIVDLEAHGVGFCGTHVKSPETWRGTGLPDHRLHGIVIFQNNFGPRGAVATSRIAADRNQCA